MGCVAVLNAGSSSIKFAVHGAEGEAPPLCHGQIEGLGTAPHLILRDPAGATLREARFDAAGFGHDAAAIAIEGLVRAFCAGRDLIGFGHRVVHGGRAHAAPARVTPALIAELAALVPLAPLHQPHNLAPMRALAAHFPGLPQVACFDTAFHATQPAVARAFALPRELTAEGVIRYGFHGLSYEYIARRLAALAPGLARGRVIVAHLGNGASACALRDGRSVASTMGFTAVDGLMMGTRSGALDPGVLLYLMDRHGMDARALETLLYRQSGLLGVSGIAADMRTLRASASPAAAEAIALFCYRLAREIGSLAAALGGLDGLVFTGGIGEHDGATRAEVARLSAWLGVAVDPARNDMPCCRISAEAATVETWVIPTDEEWMIARHTLDAIAALPAA